MTIVRSLGATTLVALMAAHRAAAEQCGDAGLSFDQVMVEALEAYLRRPTECPESRLYPASRAKCDELRGQDTTYRIAAII